MTSHGEFSPAIGRGLIEAIQGKLGVFECGMFSPAIGRGLIEAAPICIATTTSAGVFPGHWPGPH